MMEFWQVVVLVLLAVDRVEQSAAVSISHLPCWRARLRLKVPCDIPQRMLGARPCSESEHHHKQRSTQCPLTQGA